MIITASRRTDITAFYTAWFMNRVRAGYCLVQNPYYPEKVSRVSLLPEDVSVFAICTRNAAPLLPYLDELDARGYHYFFHYTVTGYDRSIDACTPSLRVALDTMERLAERVAPERIRWRYDPIIFTNTMPPAFHADNFAALAGKLKGITHSATISIMDDYRGARIRLRRLAEEGITLLDVPPESKEFGNLMCTMSETAAAHGMSISSCAEVIDLAPFGIPDGKCIDAGYIERVFGITVKRAKDSGQRASCGCAVSRDIGAYDTCMHECVYCYATHNTDRARRRHAGHDPNGEMLVPR